MLNISRIILTVATCFTLGNTVACGALETSWKSTRLPPSALSADSERRDPEHHDSVDTPNTEPRVLEGSDPTVAEPTPTASAIPTPTLTPEANPTGGERDPAGGDNIACATAQALRSKMMVMDCMVPSSIQFCSFTEAGAAPIIGKAQGCFPHAPEEALAQKLCDLKISVKANFLERLPDWKYEDSRIQCFQAETTFPAPGR